MGDWSNRDSWPAGVAEHDVCLATRLCRRCGASAKAIARGDRAPYCEPGVVGISWIRAVERIRVLMGQPTEAPSPTVQIGPLDDGPTAA